MPVALAGALVAGFTTTATTTLAGFAFSYVAAGVSLALSGLSMLLSPKPKKQDTGSYGALRSSGATHSVRQAVTERDMAYGELRRGGNVVYAGVTGANKYDHFCFVLASHEIEAIDEVIIGNHSIPKDYIDASGEVIKGHYSGVVNIQFCLGVPDQPANSFMVSNIPEWTTDHRLLGMAYIYVRFTWNQDKFPQGTPNVSCWMRGKKILDTRDNVTRYSANLSLITQDYLTDELGGRVNREKFVNNDITSASANTCDEYVQTQALAKSITGIDINTGIISLSGDNLAYQTGDKVQLTSGAIGGISSATDYYIIAYQHQNTPRIMLAASMQDAFAHTHIILTSGSSGELTKIAEPRYHGGGIVKTSSTPQANIIEMLACMMGQAVYSGGSWRIYAGEYQLPTISFNENDLVGGISVKTYQPKTDRFNRVQGIYTSPLHTGNPSDYPVVKNSTYETEDNGILTRTLDQPFTQRSGQAQRVAKVSLERMRQEIVFETTFKLTAFKVQVGDNFYFSFDKWGWSNKVFEVIEWTLANEGGAPVVKMTCRENASSVYDWNNGEETLVDSAVNTNLLDPFKVNPPTSLAVYPEEIRTQLNDLTYQFTVKWSAPNNAQVVSGGRYEVQFKQSNQEDYRPSFFVDGSLTQTQVNQVQPSINYDVRVRAVSNIGVRSVWTSLTGFTVESPSGATVQIDFGSFNNDHVESFDFGSFQNPADQTLDYGEFV